MALDASNVRVGVTGAIYVAPEGSAVPTDATTALDEAFEDVGYISDAGITESHATETNDVVAWQNGDTVRTVQTSHNVTFSFVMIETSEVTLREYYGDYAAGVVEVTGAQLPHRSWVLSVLDGDHTMRIVVEDGQITERGDITYVNGEAVGREVTLTAYPVDGVKATIYLDDGEES